MRWNGAIKGLGARSKDDRRTLSHRRGSSADPSFRNPRSSGIRRRGSAAGRALARRFRRPCGSSHGPARGHRPFRRRQDSLHHRAGTRAAQRRTAARFRSACERAHRPRQSQASARLRGAARERTLTLDIVDYPGEWLLDLPLLSTSYAEWSRQTLELARAEPRRALAAEWHEHLTTLRPLGPEDEPAARTAARLFSEYL